LQRLERKLPENDTLRLLKGYCLMEMGEGAEALIYFEKLKGKKPDWELTLEWYRGLSSLLTGDKEQAMAIFSKIAAEPRHPYREQSKKAIQVLK
jgi:tetratricopeptide (TPR) repeat protein